MKPSEFTSTNKIYSTVYLKDGRILYTTKNGFKYWVQNNTGTKVEEINAAQYHKSKLHRETKKNR